MTDTAPVVELEVLNVFIDRSSSQPMLILRAKDDGRLLPVPVSIFDALMLSQMLQGRMADTPTTHDLIVELLRACGSKLVEIRFHDVHEGAGKVRLVVDTPSRRVEVDARPSDAVSLAIRETSPITADRGVIDILGVAASPGLTTPDWDTLLKGLPDSAFGRYHM